jgi:epoxyqueuosine reductase
MPLLPSQPNRFDTDEFCASCQICTSWYVDFDKCIPYFAETSSCCIRPTVRPKLLATMARRLQSEVLQSPDK